MSEMLRTISMGKPVLAPFLVPVKHNATPNCINAPFMINGECYKITAMSFGSPHGAVFMDCIDTSDIPNIGRALGTHSLFPKGANIVFIQMLDNETLNARLWCIGKGETDFSAEAVCVAGVTAMMLHRILSDKATVRMGDYRFTVDWNRGTTETFLTGPAEIFEA